jgi:hypothetical protein
MLHLPNHATSRVSFRLLSNKLNAVSSQPLQDHPPTLMSLLPRLYVFSARPNDFNALPNCQSLA